MEGQLNNRKDETGSKSGNDPEMEINGIIDGTDKSSVAYSIGRCDTKVKNGLFRFRY